ncbi:TetR/AcrR family transcriptional regulator [Micromonospora polyrhachis]|uniref:AcrR family transcriptional regulator n=1 Tax=Micromonospora polyrhachis TaxID=1282883 RepID=A0A7W7WQ10_9ACTN|nr:TetR/AcrR family transcriptional regulator [Micromonospora polyrhachis]MBB4959329.1 AcrR family transcriptional regulator [Micromonospora polyrhachis]
MQQQSEGGLRTRLVEVGVDLVARDGVEALSLREIARGAGVSHGAPRRYFPTHQSLLAAIAQQGYRALARRIEPLLDEDAHPRAQVYELGREYLAFARTNRGMFELMFRHDLLRGNQIGLREDSLRLFEILVQLVARAVTRATTDRPPAVVAGALWANLQGIAQLTLWGSLQLATQTEDVDLLLRTAVEAHLPTPPRSEPTTC